jgi:hypothetical protein
MARTADFRPVLTRAIMSMVDELRETAALNRYVV